MMAELQNTMLQAHFSSNSGIVAPIAFKAKVTPLVSPVTVPCVKSWTDDVGDWVGLLSEELVDFLEDTDCQKESNGEELRRTSWR